MAEITRNIVIIMLVFTALTLACAVAIALRRDAGIGRRPRQSPADPLLFLSGSACALPRKNAGGGHSTRHSVPAVRTLLKGGRDG